jgi:hypothetical protein
VGPERGWKRRPDFESGREQWARAHGLEPRDGAYLVELASGAHTLRELGEGMAIFSQSHQMVVQTLTRLVSLGVVEPR